MDRRHKQLTMRLNADLYSEAKLKCRERFGIGLSPLIKVFLKAFVTQGGVGFYVGDQDLRVLFTQWLRKKNMEIGRAGCARLSGPRLKDLYEL